MFVARLASTGSDVANNQGSLWHWAFFSRGFDRARCPSCVCFTLPVWGALYHTNWPPSGLDAVNRPCPRALGVVVALA